MSRTNMKECSLDDFEKQCIEVLGTPFGHNIIGIICQQVKEKFGKEEADRLFELYQG